MEKTNNKISNFQFAIMSFFMTGSLFVGLGINSMFSLVERDIWITVLIGIVLSIIPALLFIYIFNYQPDKNIFEKNKILFGNWLGSGINILLCILVYIFMLLVIWSFTNFSITIYLTKTPEYFITVTFAIVACYAVIKGLETIARTSEVLFYFNIIFISIIIISLIFQFNTSFFKPVLVHGLSSVLLHSITFLSYLFTPLIIMTVIPKNSIINNKHSNLSIICGFIMGAIFMAIVFILVTGVITPELATIYRFPAYYVQRKVSIGGTINNLENFLSIHWFFNCFILIMLGIYFISKGSESFVNIKSIYIKNIIILTIGLSLVFTGPLIFSNVVFSSEFMEFKYALIIGLTVLALCLLMIITIFFKRQRKKAVNSL